jgi:methionyl-tRNA synthetase
MERMNISFDGFIRTTDARAREGAGADGSWSC